MPTVCDNERYTHLHQPADVCQLLPSILELRLNFLISLLFRVCFRLYTDTEYVTCGSAVKLSHFESNSQLHEMYFLNSESKNLGTGSGQQIVTATANPTTTNTLWWVRGPDGDGRLDQKNACQEGPASKIECGSLIRLTHLNSMKNLHSHGVSSPLSRQQEVTAYGAGDGLGDGGDDWKVVCKGDYWTREGMVQLQHLDTGKYLGASSTVKFTHQNCGHQCPILNHLEIFGRGSQDNYGYFVVEMGVHLSR
jgi:dolichyl-phosphate-mannose--protein O-mannosyl transferase